MNLPFTRRSILAAGGFSALCTSRSLATQNSPTADHTGSAEATPYHDGLADRVVDALEAAYGTHPRQRRNHAKGIGGLGSFTGNPEMARYSRSALFSGSPVEVVARFSIAGGNPDVRDADPGPRGLGLEFRLPGGALHHMTMLNTPMFFAAIPTAFLDKILAVVPDPRTGRADPAHLQAFARTHPNSAAQTRFLKQHNPPPSYAESAFFGIHTFCFLDRDGGVTKAKFRFAPHDGERSLSDAEIAQAPADFLETAFRTRLARGPVRWSMIVTIGRPDDEERDPTVLWPADRPEMEAGVLSIDSVTASEQAGSFRINYDPLLLADGIEASGDPILLFRSPSYGVSHARRLQESAAQRDT